MANQLPPNLTWSQIRLKGHLGRQWADWFDGLTITPEDNGDTLLTGLLADRAALHGLLKKVRDLGLTLISLNTGAVFNVVRIPALGVAIGYLYRKLNPRVRE